MAAEVLLGYGVVTGGFGFRGSMRRRQHVWIGMAHSGMAIMLLVWMLSTLDWHLYWSSELLSLRRLANSYRSCRGFEGGLPAVSFHLLE